MKKVILIMSFMSLLLPGILDRDFHMEYIIKINDENKGALKVFNQNNKVKVEYINIDRNDNLPFFYKQKNFEYLIKKGKLYSKKITIDKNYQIKYLVDEDEADEYNIARVDIKTTSAIKDLDADEVIATFHKNPLNTLEGLMMYFMNNKKIKTKDRIWLYEPQKNILFNLGVLSQVNTNKIINGRKFKAKKYTIGRISFDNTKKIKLFEVYTYKNLVLSLKSSKGKYELILDGIGKYKKGAFSATQTISNRTMKKLQEDHFISINTSNNKGQYKNGEFIISSTLEIPKSTIKKREDDNLFNYLKIANSDDLKGGNGLKFKSLSKKNICSYIRDIDPDKYQKDCKFDNNKIDIKFYITDINEELKGGKYGYKKCNVKDDNNLIAKYQKQLNCIDKFNDTEEIKNMADIGKIIFKNYNKNNKSKYKKFTYLASDREIDVNKEFYLKLSLVEHNKVPYEELIKRNASSALKNKFFSKSKIGEIKHYLKGNKYGFSINEKKFHLYICDKESSLKENFSYNKGGCYLSEYIETFSESDEKGYISHKLNTQNSILKLIGRPTRKEQGKIYFEELQGKAYNNFRF